MLSVSRHVGRSLVTTVGSVLGAAAFVATLGISTTIGQQVSDSFDVRRATEVRVVAEQKDIGQAWLADNRMAQLRGLNGVAAAGRRTMVGQFPIRRGLGAVAAPVEVIGADPGAVKVMDPHFVIGRTFDAFHEDREVPVVLLSIRVAGHLGVSRVGVAVFIGDRPFTVMGIFDDVARRPEALLAAVVPATVADSFGLIGGATAERDVVIATAPGAAQLIGQQAPFALYPEDHEASQSIAPPDPRTLRREVEASVTRSSLILSLVALVIGAISIANSATAAIAARVPEIGLRRAVGARPAHIFAQLLGETTSLGALGGVVGFIVGIGATIVISLINRWSPVLDVRTALVAAAASAGFGLLAGLLPAVRAMGIQPVAALQR